MLCSLWGVAAASASMTAEFSVYRTDVQVFCLLAIARAGTVSESFRSERNSVEVERDGGEATGQHECNPRHTRTATPRLHDRSTERNVFGVSSGTSSRTANARRWRTYRFFGLLSCYSRVISLVCRSTSRATLKPILCASS